MIFLTIAVAISAWLVISALGPTKQVSQVESAVALRDFVAYNFSVSQPINVQFGDRGFRFPDLVEAAQLQLDYRLRSDNVPYRYPLVDRLPENIERPPTEIERMLSEEVVLTDDEYVVSTLRHVNSESGSTKSETDSENISKTNLEKFGANNSEIEKNANSSVPDYFVELYFQDVPKLSLDLVQLKAYMAYHLDFIHQNDLPFFLTQAVYDLLLKPDLDMWREMKAGKRRFSDVIRHLNVNFIAAEDSSNTPVEISEAITQFMRQFEAFSSYVNISSSVHTLDVSKRKPAVNFLKNSTTELTFFYSTTMREYADSIYGVSLWHMNPIKKEINIEGDVYGTEYQQRLQTSQTDTFNVTSFLQEVSGCIKKSVHFPLSSSSNMKLMAESSMKHYTILGLIESLDMLIKQGLFESKVYESICTLIDQILVEQSHDWASHLTRVSSFYKELRE